MMNCVSCSSPVPEQSRFCPRCGAALAPSSEAPTILAHRVSVGVSSSDSLDEGQFTAGTILAGRYRIIGLLGRGGMGEVYRADDLTLGQPVALKFLPASLASDAGRLARFISEVRIARQVSHPNVCRVYDIGEVDGDRFLSMEYVAGEDLASLLRRIGRFSTDKAVEIARQICAGLAAAHDKGVVHRDLKPANVMIDERGKVRITDFGLASLAAQLRGGEVRVGTPAYMAPEQLAGKEVSVRSDIYSLGLVLYEMFTGRPAFKPGTLADLVRSREEGTPASPSSYVTDLDPAVERAILRCLEKEPRSRPASALAVAAALPGGDPLAAALAAGETPAPEVVAAAGEEGGLRPAIAWTCLAATLVGLALLTALSARLRLAGRVPLEKPPDVLADRSREILRRLGHPAPAVDTASGFTVDEDYLRYVKEHDPSPKRWDQLTSGRPASVYFWYRQSPQPMIARPGMAAVKPADPPPVVSGMARVDLDPRGRLLRFEAVPPQVDDSGEQGVPPDWSSLFSEAGLDPTAFTPTRSTWTPPMFTDNRAAWEGSYPERPEARIRIEAGGYRGRPVFFRIVGPWTRPEQMEPVRRTLGQKTAENVFLALFIAALIGALLLTRRNLRLGRGDRAGASKVAGFFVAIHLIVWALWAHHVATPTDEWKIFLLDTGYTLFLATFLWLLYIALEPFVRRRWPDTIISWSRILGGRFRDPLVGRDILIGSVVGVGGLLLAVLGESVPGWMGLPPPRPDLGGIENLIGLRFSAANVLDIPIHAVFQAMLLLFILLLLRLLLRKQWLAAGALVALLTLQASLQSDHPYITAGFAGALFVCFAYVVIRFGLLAMTATLTFLSLLNMVVTTDFSAWYAGSTLLALLVGTAIAVYGFHTSLAGRPMFGSGLLEEG